MKGEKFTTSETQPLKNAFPCYTLPHSFPRTMCEVYELRVTLELLELIQQIFSASLFFLNL